MPVKVLEGFMVGVELRLVEGCRFLEKFGLFCHGCGRGGDLIRFAQLCAATSRRWAIPSDYCGKSASSIGKAGIPSIAGSCFRVPSAIT